MRDRRRRARALLPTFADGPTERDFALDLEVEMRGAARAATASIRSSRRAPTVRSRTRARRPAIERGELVVIDFGCIVDGYCSDMTRTVSVGDPGRRRASHLGCRAARASGRPRRGCVRRRLRGRRQSVSRRDRRRGLGRPVRRTARATESGSRSTRRRGWPSTARDTLVTGAIVTVEPGVYLPGVGGVRIEDTVVVTPDGSDPLTRIPEGPPRVSISTNDLKNGMALNLPPRAWSRCLARGGPSGIP